MKLCLKINFFLLLYSFSFCFSNQYLYPVATVHLDKLSFICVLHQVCADQLQLYFWDPKSKIAQKALSSRFNAAALQIIPGQKGFSFIDGGRIRVKEFIKKSPRSIDVSEPLYGFSGLKWIDQNSFYLSAKRGRFFGIFEVDFDGIDCMYPQKVCDFLFYVERCGDKSAVVSAEYPLVNKIKKEDTLSVEDIIANEQRVKKSLIKRENIKVIYEQFDKKIVFLHVQNKSTCFFLQHLSEINTKSKVLQFSYNQLKKVNNNWENAFLFNFFIPVKLLFSKNTRLYESILPFIPFHNGDDIYYSNSLKKLEYNTLDLFCFSLKDLTIEQKTFGDIGDCFFSPKGLGRDMFYGFAEGPKFGSLNFSLPYLIDA